MLALLNLAGGVFCIYKSAARCSGPCKHRGGGGGAGGRGRGAECGPRGPRGRRGRRGRRERHAGRERVGGRQCTWDEPAGRVGGVTVRCARKRHERVWDESEGFVWIDELYLTFKQEESSVRAQSARAVGAWA